ncbi:hypothetical protein [Streptomyces sp. NPDC004267]|uniref:hypothetical protein n=1 Tax=Streptomyces sp. NPDC004267 TaxID=3364694 RepID=UPI0036C893EF
MHARDNADNATKSQPPRGRAPDRAPALPPALAGTAGNAAVVQMLRQAGHPWATPEQHRHGAGCGHGQDRQGERPAVQRTAAAPAELAVQRAPAASAAPADLAVQRLAIEDAPSSWQGQPVRRSGEGVFGVYFVGGPGEEVVVKPVWSTGDIEYAHRFLEHMGIQAPRIVRHAIGSAEGDEISALLRNQTTEEIEQQLSMAQAFLVMEMAPGASLQTMGTDAAVAFLHDEASLRQIGRTMVADAFLGNGDRITTSKANLGNFLYQAAAVIAPGAAGQITAIDNEARFPAPKVAIGSSGNKRLEGGLDAKVGHLQGLRAPARANPYIDKFLERLRISHRERPEVTAILDDPAQKDRLKDLLGAGITAAFADLASVFNGNGLLLRAIASGDYDEASAQHRSVNGAKAAAKYVMDTQSGMTHDQAVQKLITYVEQRIAKDRLPSGLKWAAKLVA